MLAAMNGHTAAVKLLLDMGSDINAQVYLSQLLSSADWTHFYQVLYMFGLFTLLNFI